MKQEDGLWLAINGGALADKIHYAIEKHGQFSYPIPQGDYRPRRAELVIVSLGDRKQNVARHAKYELHLRIRR
jgi:hypothetical protein